MQKITNCTVARDSLIRRLNIEGSEVTTLNQKVDNDTRKGVYINTRLGLSSVIYFVGIGRNKADDSWREIVEVVD